MWDLKAEKALQKSVKGHTRGIRSVGTINRRLCVMNCCVSDLSWSPHEANLFVTCSADTYVYIWDLRCATLLVCLAVCGMRSFETERRESQRWHGRLLVRPIAVCKVFSN